MAMPFREYMRLWLYEDDGDKAAKGYYANGRPVVGKDGDFYTSVSLSKFFGGAIAHYVLRLLEDGLLKPPVEIVEIGSDNGDLIADIAEFLSALNAAVFRESSFCSLEPLGRLRARQAATFKSRVGDRFGKELRHVKDLDSLAPSPGSRFFISNELFDSLPCDLVLGDRALFVEASYAGASFSWRDLDSRLASFRAGYGALGAELSLEWATMAISLARLEGHWVFLSFDYGDFTSREINLRLYKNHEVFNFYEELEAGRLASFYQKSDLTYDVDFGLLSRIFENHGFKILFCLTQAKALIEECHILDLFESFCESLSDQARLRQQLKLRGLITPNALGERFKSICITNA